MAKILITNKSLTEYLTGNLSREEYSFTKNINQAFCFQNISEATKFEKEEAVAIFLSDKLTDLVDYDNPGKSVSQGK